MDVGPGSVEVRFHERVPAARLVSQVDPRFKQFVDRGHTGHVEIVRVRERADNATGGCACAVGMHNNVRGDLHGTLIYLLWVWCPSLPVASSRMKRTTLRLHRDSIKEHPPVLFLLTSPSLRVALAFHVV